MVDGTETKRYRVSEESIQLGWKENFPSGSSASPFSPDVRAAVASPGTPPAIQFDAVARDILGEPDPQWISARALAETADER